MTKEDDKQAASLEERLRAVYVGGAKPSSGPIVLVDYDPAWPKLFAREAERIGRALGERIRTLEHVGSTSVPGLAAKPIIDILLAVDDSADEAAYVPQLEAEGYVLRVREPDWYQHRHFKGPDTHISFHVFSAGCEEIERMLRFRDHLRSHDEDRALYERTKRELAKREWKFVQAYADAKSEVVREILVRAMAARSG
jgi:GrpB-like predicted nucleotidyltransferase (UPF0157 family)